MSTPEIERTVVVQGSETRGDYYTYEESVNVTLHLMSDGTVKWDKPAPFVWEQDEK
jgi:hypothetical protein